MTASNDRFYEELPAFDSFDGATEFEAYTPVPDDWVVLISDVVGSTVAIREGRYKDVNMVGAATITAVLNACDTTAVPVAELRRRGVDVTVRKFLLSPGNHLAMLAGGGAELADDLIKDASGQWLLKAEGDRTPPDLEGLSCRWQPLSSRDGTMMTLMIKGRDSDPAAEAALLRRVLTNIARILGHDLTASAPANEGSMKFSWPPAGADREARSLARGGPVLKKKAWVLGTGLVQAWCEKFDKKAGDYDAPKYRQELRANTDFRKYDGVLRTVLDVTTEQAHAVEAYLEREHQAGHLVYGVYLTDAALMTCLVFSLEQSEHVHFIDGSDGGFAMAAVGFKERMKAAAPA